MLLYDRYGWIVGNCTIVEAQGIGIRRSSFDKSLFRRRNNGTSSTEMKCRKHCEWQFALAASAGMSEPGSEDNVFRNLHHVADKRGHSTAV